MSNKLILGTVQFGLAYGVNNSAGQVTTEQSSAILEHAYNNGVTSLDTASSYGDSELVIGNYIDKNPGKNFNIITKFSNRIDCGLSLETSLQRLRSHKISSILFHSFLHYAENKHELDYFIRKYKDVNVETIGVSVYTNEELAQLGQDDRINVVQLPFNILDNHALRSEAVLELKSRGKTIHTRSAFLQGLFFMDAEKIPEKLSPLKEPINLVKQVCNEHRLNIGHLALQYVLQKSYIDGVLIGVDSVTQLKQNIEWSEVTIPQEVFRIIDTILIEDLNLLNPSTW
ncbi:aldo/keto reductase [Dyadobacter chenhuakuii]|uniref:Aldo/keto reductase n=1 Tax=Dyadobacter chenhuakuii TaxID=2909339 RepID=A0A9X1QGZ1_9BACT|nr:aldo/keto reductase [Dyadobacter chenhuakuii]MCF2500103.1 aldo/keto reductase [Dyadobacter chenhuakuii]